MVATLLTLEPCEDCKLSRTGGRTICEWCKDSTAARARALVLADFSTRVARCAQTRGSRDDVHGVPELPQGLHVLC